MKKTVIFWQREPSIHQAPLFRALCEQAEISKVIAVFQSPMREERIKSGCQTPDYGNTELIINSSLAKTKDLINLSGKNNIHIFSSITNDKNIRSVFREKIKKNNSFIGLLSEGRDWRGLKGKLRILQSTMYERFYREKVNFVLSIGYMGAIWYKKCGYTTKDIFDFSYVVESNLEKINVFEENNYLTFVFIGRLVEIKKLDLLFEAFSKLSNKDWQLKIIGDGPKRNYLEKLAEELGISEKVIFTGTLENSIAREALGKADVLLLTSYWDGWGAVVNEALMAGVPVVCSNFCGASDLIYKTGYGEVFEYGSLGSLKSVLEKWINNGPLQRAKRQEIMEWSKCIEADAIARYLDEILEYVIAGTLVRPVAPWKYFNG